MLLYSVNVDVADCASMDGEGAGVSTLHLRVPIHGTTSESHAQGQQPRGCTPGCRVFFGHRFPYTTKLPVVVFPVPAFDGVVTVQPVIVFEVAKQFVLLVSNRIAVLMFSICTFLKIVRSAFE